MKTKFIQILTLVLITVFQIALAQQVVTGSVTDQNGTPIPGATVVIKGTSSATTADFDGNYTINAENGDILVASFVGYSKAEVTVNGATINISLFSSNELDNVEVIGYKSLSQVKSTASVSRIDASTIENRPNPSIIQTLQGQIAGVDINTTSGQPGANSLINIRGIGSINGNTEPLILLDGTPINEDEFASFNPQEIEEIKVLKDAGATAIYGNRGANGVILITTKRGGYDQPLEINYNGYTAVSYYQKDDYNMMNATELLTLEKEQETGYGLTLTDEEISAVQHNDWRDVFFRAGKTQSHTISLSSGSSNTSQYTSIGFQNTEGIIITSDLKRFNLRNNLSGRSQNGKFNYNSSLSLNYSTANSPGDLGSGSINWNIVLGTVMSAPYLNLSDYNYSDPQNFAANSAGNNNVTLITPLILYDLAQKYTDLEEQQKIVYNFDTSYEINDNITFRSITGLDYSRFEALRSNPPNGWTPTYFEVADNAGQNSTQTQTTTSVFSVNQVTSLTYDQTFGDHSVTVAGYLEYFKSHYKYYGYTANGGSLKTYYPGDGSFFISDNSSNDFFADAVGANLLNAGLFSYFGSLDYDFANKYGFSAVYRRDASYRFADSNKWATFGSVAARWNIDKEDFMSDSIFDYLKLRVSYGTAGNQRINGGNYFTSPDLTKNLYSTSEGYKGLPSIQVAQFANTTLKWETIAQADIGIEFAINKWGLSGEIDLYHKKTSDLFQSKPVSAINAITRQSANIGTLYNKGVDLTLNYQMIKPVSKDDFGLDFRFVGNYNKNELQDLPSDTGYIIGIGRNGGMIGENYTIKYAGVNPANGNLLFYTKDGALTESPDADNDRVWLDNSNVPDFQGGFSISSSYKGFSLQAMFNYQVGITRYDGDYANVVNYPNLGSFNMSRDVLRAWTSDNRITDMPSFDATNANSFSSNRFYKNGDFLGLRFASLSYTLPKETTKRAGFNDVTLYLNGENLFVLTEWRGYDPFSRNEDGLDYPSPKTFTLGLNLKF